MKLKIDENLPIEAVDSLRHAGHDTATVSEQDLGGASDLDVAAVCQREKRALITLDTDFADIRAYPPEQFPGLIVLRLHRQEKNHVLEVLDHLMRVLSREPLERHLWIVEETRIRIRG